MKPIQEHGDELRQTGALDNVPEWGIKGSGTEARVHIAKQPPDTENHALLLPGEMEHTCTGTETRCPENKESMTRMNNRWSSTHSI